VSVNLTGRRSFKASYAGACTSCSAAILPGDDVFYAPGNEGVSGLDCCGDRPDEDLIVVQRRDSEDEPQMAVDVAQVLPRGKTAASACPTCWQVPASNGECGCHY
jgi:hypothetical protein